MKIRNEKISALLIFFYYIGIKVYDYTSIYLIGIALIALWWCYLSVKEKKKIEITAAFVTYFLAFSFAFSIYILGKSTTPTETFRYLQTMALNLICIFFIANLLCNKNIIINLMKLHIYLTIFLVIYHTSYSIFNGAFPFLLETSPKPFIYSNVLYSHNDIPMLAAYSILFILYLNPKRSLKYIVISLLTLFIVMSAARKSLLCATLFFIAYNFFTMKKKDDLTKTIYLFAVLGAIIIGYISLIHVDFLYDSIGWRFEAVVNGLTTGEYNESSAISRDYMIKSALKLIKESPFIGHGLASFQITGYDGRIGTWSHNNYLECMVSGGIIFTVLYYSIYIILITRLAKTKKDNLKYVLLLILFYTLFIHDLLSVSYLSRSILFNFCLCEAYINFCSINSKDLPNAPINLLQENCK